MSGVDIGIIIVVSFIMMSIIFFYFIFPHIRHKNKNHCSSCPVNKEKRIKRAFKDYHKKNK